MPTWDQFMAPVFGALVDGQVRRRPELYEMVASAVGLTDQRREQALNSGHLRYRNRMGWATSYPNRVGVLARPARGQYTITDVGRKLPADHPSGITEKDLRVLAGDENAPHTYSALKAKEISTAEALDQQSLDPVEQVDQGIALIHAEVADELLDRLRKQEPAFFEQAVLDLLMAMGYGGADGVATRTQLSNDGGIDGIIDQDALGLSRIYVQAKRYAADNVVGRQDIQAFVGALAGNLANQGVFITTSRFSTGAAEYARAVPTRVILIDGPRLATLMIRFGIGVQVVRTVQIIELDEDFFE
jgi:restriction system protein